eukprot:7386957-Pyramimonas_sp.AAC.1
MIQFESDSKTGVIDDDESVLRMNVSCVDVKWTYQCTEIAQAKQVELVLKVYRLTFSSDVAECYKRAPVGKTFRLVREELKNCVKMPSAKGKKGKGKGKGQAAGGSGSSINPDYKHLVR